MKEHWYYFYISKRGMMDAIPLQANIRVSENQLRIRQKRNSDIVIAETTNGLPVPVEDGLFFSLERAVVCQPLNMLDEIVIFTIHERGMRAGNNFLVTRNVNDLEAYIYYAFQQNKSLVLTIFSSSQKIPTYFTKVQVFGDGKQKYTGTNSKYDSIIRMIKRGVSSPNSQNERTNMLLDQCLFDMTSFS